jgi:hypothetical protein
LRGAGPPPARRGEAAKAAFRGTLPADVEKLLKDDAALVEFHDWLSDEEAGADVLARRRAAFEAVGPGSRHIRDRRPFAERLDAGEDATSLLCEILGIDREVLKELRKPEREAPKRERDVFADFDDLQKRAWALALMPKEIRADVGNDLKRAGGWAAIA